MIKSKEPQIIDAQNGISAVVFFEVTLERNDTLRGLRHFTITTYIEGTRENGEKFYHPINENVAIFKEETFKVLFGGLTLVEFDAQKNEIMKAQIEYANTHEWTGEEAQERVGYWGLMAADLETV